MLLLPGVRTGLHLPVRPDRRVVTALCVVDIADETQGSGHVDLITNRFKLGQTFPKVFQSLNVVAL